MAASGSRFAPMSADFGEETQTDRLTRKARESPLMPVGLTGLVFACAYGAYAYKRRGAMSTSVFLMQLRVTAQGAVVVCLTAGIGYSLFRDYVMPRFGVSKND